MDNVTVEDGYATVTLSQRQWGELLMAFRYLFRTLIDGIENLQEIEESLSQAVGE